MLADPVGSFGDIQYPSLRYTNFTTTLFADDFYASSVDSGSASGWVRYGLVQTVAPLASAFLALESARSAIVESETRSSRPRSVKAGALAEIMY